MAARRARHGRAGRADAEGAVRPIESYYPDLKARIDQHIEETRSQRQRLERCMERDHLDEVTRMHLSREAAGADEAKRKVRHACP